MNTAANQFHKQGQEIADAAVLLEKVFASKWRRCGFAENVDHQCLVNLFDKELLALYLQWKGRSERPLDHRAHELMFDFFVSQVRLLLSCDVEWVVLPESKNAMLANIAAKAVLSTGAKILCLEKFSKDKVLEKCLGEFEKGSEAAASILSQLAVGDDVQIAKLDLPLRKYVAPFLFKDLEVNGSALFLDDSSFSGETVASASIAIKTESLKLATLFGFPSDE